MAVSTSKYNSDLIILYSGGADSLLMLNLALLSNRKPTCLLIDYGQKHIDELTAAENQLGKMAIPFKRVKIEIPADSGLTGNLVEGQYENVHSMNVPARNTIFIGLAASLAESKGITEIWYGADYSDRENLFPDCYQDYVIQMNKLLAISGVRSIKLVAPLLGMSKDMVLGLLNIFNGETEIYSGYDGVIIVGNSTIRG
jgi:7-cyano-7-deazaguanine synthase